MRVLLVSVVKHLRAQHMCLGLRYLSSFLEAQGHETRVVRLGPPDDFYLREVTRHTSELRPEVIGISLACEGYGDSLFLARHFRKTVPEAVLLAGGPLATHIPAELIDSGLFDFVVRGDGEVAVAALLELLSSGDGADWRAIPGLCGRERRDTDELAPPVKDLNDVPFPDRRDFDGVGVQPAMLLGRGSADTVEGSLARSVDNILGEIEELAAAGMGDTLWFLDDDFTRERERAANLCAAFRQEVEVPFLCQIPPDLSCEWVQCLIRSGCTTLVMSVGSGDRGVLDALGQHVDLAQVERVARQVHDLNGATLVCQYTLGHYCDTAETMRGTVDFAASLLHAYGARPILSFNTPFPGSEQYLRRDELGLTFHGKTWDDFDPGRAMVSAAGFGVDELQGMLTYGAERLSRRATTGQVHSLRRGR